MARPSGRAPDALRHVSFERRHAKHAEGAVLVEFGFISHPEESRKLARPEYRDRIAQAIADGVVAFLAQTAARDRRPVASTAPP